MSQIGLIGAGSMGSGIGGRLVSRGATVLTPLNGRSEATVRRAAAAGMEAASPEAVARCPIILSVVPPSQAASEMATLARASGDRGIYVDLNAIAPRAAREVASLFDGRGMLFLDGCIIGGPPKEGASGPHVYISGEGRDVVGALIGLGLDARLLAGPVGAASALKMCYAGINKGLTGLGTAMLLAAADSGADEALMKEMAESLPDLQARLEKGIPDMYPKAYRWVERRCRRSQISSGRIIRQLGYFRAWPSFMNSWLGISQTVDHLQLSCRKS